MKFLWVSVLMATAASPALAQYPVYYSPAFNMPLQPAPSPRDGGFYWVMPDGCVYGPNYYLRPPFAPITGFNPTLVGQVAFAQTFESYLAGKTPQKGSRPGQQPPNGQQQQQLQQQQPPQPDPRNSFGVGKYTLDYSDPQSLSAFDTNSALPNGYMMPFGVNPAPGQVPANSQQAMPRYPNYPSMPPQEPPPGYRPADPRWSGSMSPAYPSGVQYANYQLTNWQGPIVPTQAIEMGPPPTRLPDYGSYGSAPNPGTMQPGMGYPPNCMQYMPCAPGYRTSQACMPNLPPLPSIPGGYCMSIAPPAYPNLPCPSYTPNLPTPGYEPCSAAQQPQPGPGAYGHHPLIRSPRDFFMWGDMQDELTSREGKALRVP